MGPEGQFCGRAYRLPPEGRALRLDGGRSDLQRNRLLQHGHLCILHKIRQRHLCGAAEAERQCSRCGSGGELSRRRVHRMGGGGHRDPLECLPALRRQGNPETPVRQYEGLGGLYEGRG